MTLGSTVAAPAQKKCGRCQTVKPAAAFCVSRSRGDGLHARCRECASAHYKSRAESAKAKMREYHAKNREVLLPKQRANWAANRDARLESLRRYQAENRDRVREQQREYRRKNVEAIAIRNRSAYLKNKPARNEYAKKWNAEQRANDIIFRLKSNLRTRTNGIVRRGGFTKLSSMSEVVGCDWGDLKTHLENHFTAEMSWENYGLVWVIDHHVPLASAESIEDVMRLCHFTNLRPLGKAENLRKGAKMPKGEG